MIVDIHNHILPGLDDGPKNWEETILLAKQAVETGINHVIATPHHKHVHREHFYENDPLNILDQVNKANELLVDHRIPLTIYPGLEIHMYEDILKDLDYKLESFLSLNDNGKFLLIELPCHYYPSHTEDALKRIQEKGFIPIIAHPERNRVLRGNPEKIYSLVQNRALVQLTAGSITGQHGRRLKNFSLHLLNHDLVHFVASDAHHHIRRKFELVSSYEYINEKFSAELSRYLKDNAVQIIEGKEVSKNTPRKIDKKRQYFFLYNHPLNSKGVSI
ncbi:CpsB/CapC family capsule biosynthesis tyrosine phosphatase [Bacillus sp. ISL-37]|uniref:tyrosine-protein phosphatase n=1 Tax=Bacillus sp. ISL-37 TaxID=2819123 RepID=UPI001BE53520|nr:CpsB/CapC family capsule biosynthesis tyrosine phosphatase [Bacillus sp. ISL-37]MBT2686215.1 tyrosine protein phosphatase [Bacillus sp. ISL-37]